MPADFETVAFENGTLNQQIFGMASCKHSKVIKNTFSVNHKGHGWKDVPEELPRFQKIDWLHLQSISGRLSKQFPVLKFSHLSEPFTDRLTVQF